MRINPKKYKGIDYIQLTDLPLAQQQKFVQTVNQSLFIKIMIDKKIISQCIQYKDYEWWFDTVYNVSEAEPEKVVQTLPDLEIAFSKI